MLLQCNFMQFYKCSWPEYNFERLLTLNKITYVRVCKIMYFFTSVRALMPTHLGKQL
jgi:hypothetical protein